MAHRPRIVTEGDERPRWLHWLVVVGAVVLAIGGGYGVFTLLSTELSERYSAMTGDRTRLLELRRELSQRLQEEKAETEALRERLAYLEKSQQIDREACQQLRSSLRDMQAKLVDAQEQLAFYRGIVSPAGGGKAVRVHEFVVYPTSAGMRYELVLVRSGQHDRRARGRFQVRIEGLGAPQEDGERMPETLEVRGAEGEKDMLFSFRHFQEFAGVFAIPEGFAPRRVLITVQRDGAEDPNETSYEWQRVVADKGA